MKPVNAGNLRSELAATAIPYAKKAEFPKDAPLADGKRFCFIGYKASKTNAEPPTSFAIQVPNLCNPDGSLAIDPIPGRWTDFVCHLAADYQDAVAHATADGESTVQPDDWPAMIADYFDTSRGSGITRAIVKEWLTADNGFVVAFTMRQLSMPQPKPAEQIAKLANGYGAKLLELCGRTCGLDKAWLTSLRQVVEKLIEVGTLARSDETDYLLAQVQKFQNATDPAVLLTEDSI